MFKRILDRLFPFRTLPTARCCVCNKVWLKEEMVKVSLVSYACNSECELEYQRRVAW